MRRRVVAWMSLLVLVSGLATWFIARKGAGGGSGSGGVGAGDPAAGGRGASDVIARKRAARKEAPVDETPARLAGRVTAREGGRPLGGADVTLVQLDGEERQDGVPRHLRTGADGTWAVEGLEPAKWVVSAAADGFLPARTKELELAPGQARAGVDLALEAGGLLVTGTITDIGGGPIGEALVVASHAGFDDDRASPGTTTGEDGRYRLTVAAGTYNFGASHALYASARRLVAIQGAGQTVDLALVPGGTISGRVLTRAGKRPVPRAGVVIQPGGGGRQAGFRPGHTTIADDEGRFTVRGLEPGELAVRASARGVSSSEPTSVDLGVGEELTDVEVLVDTAYTVSGFVVKKGTEVGVRGVSVGGFSMKSSSVQAARPTEADGYFQLDGVRPGSYMLYAQGGEGTVPSMMQRTFVVVDKDLTDLLIELADGVTITGRVEPATVARVSLEIDGVGLGNMGSAIAAGMIKESSTPDGRFTLTGVPDGTLKVIARTEDGRKGSAEVTIAGKSVADVVVELADRASIAGKVTDRSGRPVVGVRVRGERKRAEGEGMSLDFDDLLSGGAVVLPDGSFHLRGLDPGTYRLRVSDEHGDLPWADAAHRARPKEPIEVLVALAEAKAGVALVVERSEGVVRGVVLGADGKPAVDAFVSVVRAKAPPRAAAPGEKRTMSVSVSLGGEGAGADVSDREGEGEADDGPSGALWRDAVDPVMTDAAGRFTIEGLEQGAYDVTAEALRGAGRATAPGVRTGASVTLRLEALGSLTGLVSLGGAPVTDYTIEAVGPSDARARGGADGRYALPRLQAGAYELKVVAKTGAGKVKTTVAAGAPSTVDVALVGWGSVRGTVVDARTGKPMGGLKVIGLSKDAIDEDAMISALMGGGDGPRSDASGRFEVGRLAEGDGALLFLPSTPLAGFEPVGQHTFVLAAGQTLDLGTVKLLPPPSKASAPGTLGMTLDAARWAGRPGATPGAPPAGVEESTKLLWIDDVTPGGPAASAGLKRGDRVLAIDGFRVGDVDPEGIAQLAAAGKVATGQAVTVTLERGDVIVTAIAVAPPVR